MYRADQATAYADIKWRPPIHMPRWASRITLEITGVRVQQVQDINARDAALEGYPPRIWGDPAIEWFCELWDSLYAGSGYGWEDNPYVWAIEFKVVNDGNDSHAA